MILLIGSLIPSLTLSADNSSSVSAPEPTNTAVWFVQLDNNVLVELARVQLDDSSLNADGTVNMDKVKSLFDLKTTATKQGLLGKKALITIFDELCLSQSCQDEMADDCFSETGSAQCLDNPIQEGWCLFTQEEHRSSLCFGCTQACDAFVIE